MRQKVWRGDKGEYFSRAPDPFFAPHNLFACNLLSSKFLYEYNVITFRARYLSTVEYTSGDRDTVKQKWYKLAAVTKMVF